MRDNNLQIWAENILYPSLFQVADQAFPEFQFRKSRGAWISTTGKKVTGEDGRKGAVYLYPNNPYSFKDFTRGSKAITTYLIEQGRAKDWLDSLTLLSRLAGVGEPPINNPEEFKKHQDKQNLLEICSNYFIWSLESADSTTAQQIREYLKGRGYSDEKIKKMGVGYIPSQEKLYAKLKEEGYTEAQIQEALPIHEDKRIGSTHQLTVPYITGGRLQGFNFRVTGEPGKAPKYLLPKGMDKSSVFFNISPLKGDKDLVIVEGELDSLSASADGIENVVAVGGTSITESQIEDAIKRGAKKFTLCFDEGEAGAKATDKAISLILRLGGERIYIANLKGEDKDSDRDPDSIIKDEGVEALQRIIDTAEPYFNYRADNTVEEYKALQIDNILPEKKVDELLEKLVIIGGEIPQPVDRDRYINRLLQWGTMEQIGISRESLEVATDRIASNREKEAQSKELNTLLSRAKELHSKGDTDKALELLDSKTKEVKLRDKATEFSSLLVPTIEQDIKQRLRDKPESISSGYKIAGEELLLPSGAISIFSAPTSHGKTTFLINLALNTAKTTDKEIYFFSYEEDRDSILLNALNTYQGKELSRNNRRSIANYFTTDRLDFIKNDEVLKKDFIDSKNKFFRELIDTRKLNIHYSSYDSDTLIELIRYLYKNANPGAIFIDYIQLLNLPTGKYKTYSRQEEIKEIVIALKDIAVETGLPIILGAQFNREVTNQLRIHATKIGEAGDIERIANLIVGFYNNTFEPIASPEDRTQIQNKGVVIGSETIYATILKNRGGKVGGEEILQFNGNLGLIKNNDPLPFETGNSSNPF